MWISHRAGGQTPAKADGETVCGEEAEERGEWPRPDHQMSRDQAQWSSHDGMSGSLKRLRALIQGPVKTGSSPRRTWVLFLSRTGGVESSMEC